MRRLIALLSCAACLVFGLAVGAVHVHVGADHHAEMRGLHMDHVHLGEGFHQHDHAHGDEHVAHHEGDAHYLAVFVKRTDDSGLLAMPADIVERAVIDPSIVASPHLDVSSSSWRGPPDAGSCPARAPPV